MDEVFALGVHGIGGLTGVLLTGVFAVKAVGETSGLLEGNPGQMVLQLYGIGATLIWSGIGTLIILKALSIMVPLRVTHQHEIEGLDVTQHGESLQ